MAGGQPTECVFGNGVVLFFFLLLCGVDLVSGDVYHETLLRQHLFPPRFNPDARPVNGKSENVTVSVDISLSRVVDLNEKLQTVYTDTWVRLEWEDPQLTWEPAAFGNVSVIYVAATSVWTPDVIVHNEVGIETGRSPMEYLISVTPKGKVQWLFMRTMETSCKINAAQFPFDDQTCRFIFGSWAVPGNLLDVTNKYDYGDPKLYGDNGEWSLLNITVVRNVRYYKCCSEPFPDVTFTIHLQRRSAYYIFYLICPCILITLIHLGSFLLPAESGEKISMNVTILLGLTVFLLLVAEIMPSQADNIPLIGQFFGSCIILVSLSTVSSVFILHFHFRGSRGIPVSPRLRSFVIGKLGRYLRYGHLIEMKQKISTPVATDENHSVELKAVKAFNFDETSRNGKAPYTQTEIEAHARSGMSCHDDYNLNRNAKPPMEPMGFPHRHIEDKNEAEKLIIRDWILVSLIMDRLFFLVFCVIDAAFVGTVMYYTFRYYNRFSQNT